ncbi:hypothetical protein ACIQWN_32180 [Streptomyces vinaceus]|uniref:hypothetical protein n=1 Tax=Streptomyces vinaceus TaxID=1960 RepID=UPI00382E2CDF
MNDIMPAESGNPNPTAADKLYAGLTRGVAHAQIRQQLIDDHRAEVEREVRWAVAGDFRRLGETRTTDISWGEAHGIAREGLCSCNGGTKACPVGGESRG